MKQTILECNNIHKSFGNKHILKGVSLSVKEGDILGFIGPNGSGKTTTIKLILGLQTIDSGSVKINEKNIITDFENAIARVGAIVENPDFYMYMSGLDNLKIIANMYDDISEEKIQEVVKIVKLENRIMDKVSKYSLGMRQRLGIAQALIHSPNLLILDEPTNGLDPEGIKELRDILSKLAKNQNMAILISSHNLAELETFCNTVSIIQNGSIIESSSVKELKKVEEQLVVFEIDDTSKLADFKEELTIVDEDTFKINIKRSDIPKFVKKLITKDVQIFGIEEERLSLEEAFLKKTGGNKID